MKKLFVLLMVCFLVSCETKKESRHKADKNTQTEKKSDNKINVGKYVYEDRGHILHTKSGCKAVYRIPTVGMQPVTAIDVEKIISIDYSRICSQCVTSEDLDYLAALVRFNLENDELADTVAAE